MKKYVALLATLSLASQAVLAQNAGQQSATTQQTAPTGPSDQEIQKTAIAQGHNMADRVNITYGQVEKRVYSYVYGVRSGIQGAREIIGAENNAPAYQNGFASGQASAQNDGRAAGQNAGSSSGYSSGASDVASRFDSELDKKDGSGKPVLPNLTLGSISAPDQNFQANCEEPMSDAQAIETIKQDSYITSIFANLDGITRGGDYYGLDMLLQQTDYQNSLDLGDFYNQIMSNSIRRASFKTTFGNPQWAFQRWLQALNTNAARAAFYGSLTQEQQQNFEASFEAEFNSELNKDWNQAFGGDSLNGNSLFENFVELGEKSGRLALQTEMRQHGAVAGCDTGYVSAAKNAFHDAYVASYTNGFNAKKQEFLSSAEIQAVNVDIVTAANTPWLPGSPIFAVVSKIENGGEATKNLLVTIAQDVNVKQEPANKDADATVVAKASSLNVGNQVTGRLATLQVPAPNQNIDITVTVGGFQRTITVSIDPKNVLRALSDATNDQWKSYYAQYLVNALKAEWADHKGKGGFLGHAVNWAMENIYKDGKPSLLRTIEQAYEILSPSEKAVVLQVLKPQIAGIYVGGGDDKMTSAKTLVDQIK